MTGRVETHHLCAAARPRRARSPVRSRRAAWRKGDRVVIYMPMVPEAAIAMLACARLGAVHSVVFGGFAAAELAARIADAKPKRDRHRLLRARARAHREVQAAARRRDRAVAAQAVSLLILQRPQSPCDLTPGRDEDLLEAEAAADAAPLRAAWRPPTRSTSSTPPARRARRRASCATMAATRSRCTTPCPWSTASAPGDVFWAASDVGWVVGHSYIVYAPLLAGCTTVLLRGQAGRHARCRRLLARLRAARRARCCSPRRPRSAPSRRKTPRARCSQRHDLSRLEALYLAGERCDPDTVTWSQRLLGKPVVDHWWQTETGWTITGNFRGLGLFPDASPAPAASPRPATTCVVLDEANQEVPRGQIGNLAVRLPLPPSCLPTLWQRR